MNWLMEIIGYPLGWIMWAAYKVVPVYALALVIFTVIVKVAMLPLAIKQQRNTAHGMLFRPQIDAINKKYENNKQKAQEEINKLYEKEGYSPFAGCSSLFIQLPIIYGFIDVVYRPMTHILRLGSENIAKIKEAVVNAGFKVNNQMAAEMEILGSAEKYKDVIVKATSEGVYNDIISLDTDLFGIMNLGDTPALGVFNWLWIIPIFALITAMASSFITMKMTQQQNQGQNQGCNYAMTFLMPFMSAYFSFMVPAGVGLYWIISNVVTGVQSVILRKVITPEKVAAKIQKDREAGKIKKKKTLMSKLVEAQEGAIAAQGAASEKEQQELSNKQKAISDSKKNKGMSEKDKIAEARRRYAEKYGDDYNE